MNEAVSAQPDPSLRTLVDELLAEQGRLTAVERFARKHERGDVPAQARYYRDLIPAASPALGQQYAFAVDLDACTGCKACVSACHSLNGLDEDTELCLRSWFCQDYPAPVQILFAVASSEDPVCPVVSKFIAEFPQFDARLVICRPTA